ncbi:MAG: YigZ family protein, partial [Clostridia bacterium]|nr:YigZ family protein [Clostridia bacterium]
IIIERSKFICNIKGITDEADAKAFVDSIKKRHTLANHYCYAYIADETGLNQKFSDAGEPQGTAGLPMLEVLKNKRIHKTVAVVTRYFGGVKLGTGGLTRAYGGSVSECLKIASIVNMSNSVFIKIKLDYDKYSKLTKYLTGSNVSLISTNFDNDVCVDFAVKSNFSDDFINKLTDAFNGRIECKVVGKGYHAFKE